VSKVGVSVEQKSKGTCGQLAKSFKLEENSLCNQPLKEGVLQAFVELDFGKTLVAADPTSNSHCVSEQRFC